MAEHGGIFTGKCRCGAVIIDGECTLSEGVVLKAKSMNLPEVVCSRCLQETFFGGNPNHSMFETLLGAS